MVVLVNILTSCFKNDEMVPAHEPGEVTTIVIPMTMHYSNQVYFNLEKEEIVSTNTRSVFDLNFNCNDTSTIIRLNTSNFAMAAETMFENMEDVMDTTGLIWKFDSSDGSTDSLAISNWITIENDDTTYSNKVWVINRGMDALGNQLGLKKIKFAALVDGKYNFTYSNIDNSNKVEGVVEKDDLFSNIQYSFSAGAVEQTEPEHINWDLLFTQYTTIIISDDGLRVPYLVTGVLQSLNTCIALDTSMLFNDIKLSDTAHFNFSTSFDKIGYNWKELMGDVSTGNFYYETKINNVYIIKDAGSYYYKLRFTNFYNLENGEKGYPTFEFQRL